MIWLTKATNGNTASGELPAAAGHRGVRSRGTETSTSPPPPLG